MKEVIQLRSVLQTEAQEGCLIAAQDAMKVIDDWSLSLEKLNQLNSAVG